MLGNCNSVISPTSCHGLNVALQGYFAYNYDDYHNGPDCKSRASFNNNGYGRRGTILDLYIFKTVQSTS